MDSDHILIVSVRSFVVDESVMDTAVPASDSPVVSVPVDRACTDLLVLQPGFVMLAGGFECSIEC
jgi:hypothetical protein